MRKRPFARLAGFLLVLSQFVSFRPESLPRLKLFLLIGQSNMAGRGAVDTTDRQPHPRVWMLTKDESWVPARDPLHFDKPAVTGVGPGLTFARTLAEAVPDLQIGLIPAAVGGSPIDAWRPGVYYAPTKSYPYDDALRRARKAQEQGELAGILWLQGESDSKPGLSAPYGRKLAELVQRLRTDLKTPDVPFVVTTLGDFFVARNPEAAEINRILRDSPNQIQNTYCVLSAGLTHKGDTTHFDAPSARTIGRRNAELFIQKNLLNQVR